MTILVTLKETEFYQQSIDHDEKNYQKLLYFMVLILSVIKKNTVSENLK